MCPFPIHARQGNLPPCATRLSHGGLAKLSACRSCRRRHRHLRLQLIIFRLLTVTTERTSQASMSNISFPDPSMIHIHSHSRIRRHLSALWSVGLSTIESLEIGARSGAGPHSRRLNRSCSRTHVSPVEVSASSSVGVEPEV
jgi:hypothetical protein